MTYQNMASWKEVCRDINGITLGDPDNAIACVMLDKKANLKAFVLPHSLIIQSPQIFSEIALDEVKEVHHNPSTHRLVVVARSGKIEITPESFR